jgi:glycosyltransferase involved in cell wall biosynthesis
LITPHIYSSDMSKKIKFSFVILTWNRYKFLELCLENLVKNIADPATCEIVVMDNGSTDKTPEILKGYAGSPLVRVITRKANYGLNAYKRLFLAAKGEYVVIVDDDVLSFPEKLDAIFLDYMTTFTNYGFIGLNVVQNEFTLGAKPTIDHYTEETRNGKTIEAGPTGGWCTCFRKRDFRRVLLSFMMLNMNMKRSEDGALALLFQRKLKLKSGLIKDAMCLHACGPYYAKQYGHMEREIEKYTNSGLYNIADNYKTHE